MDKELGEVKEMLSGIDRRLRRIEDTEEIHRLIVSYARAADHGNDPVMMAPLFTDDAIWEAKGFGRYEGRQRVLAFMKAIASDKIWWSLHFMISPKIDFAPDGKSATLLWYLWEPATIPDHHTKEPEPNWITGVYDSEVVKTEKGWLFKRITSNMNMVSPVAEGWVKRRFPAGSKETPYFRYLGAGSYWWCRCGRSKSQPFCDDSHKGSGVTPVELTLEQTELVALCGCKRTGTRPHCDGTHLGLDLQME